jgi:hypothetical protein
MSRFRIHKSFEEELAKKADEFSMQPSMTTWRGVEKEIVKTQSIQTFWKIGVLSLSILAVIGILFIQDDKKPTPAVYSETGITLVSPLSTSPSAKGSGNKTPGVIERPAFAKATEGAPAFAKAAAGEEIGFETLPVFVDPSIKEAEKIILKPVQPKASRIVAYLEKITGNKEVNREKQAPGGKKRDAWYVQVNFSPAYAYRNISARTDFARPLENTKKQLDKGVTGYSTRVQARYHFSDRFSLAFGLGYTRSGERIGMAPRKDNPTYDALAQEYEYELTEMNSLGTDSYYSNEYAYTELPVTLYSKKPLGPRLSLTTGLGLSLGYMVATNARCYDYRVDHYVNNEKFLRDWTIGSHAQVLLEYSLNTRWAVAAGPEFNYALLSTYRNYYTLSQHQFSVGMNFGVQWKLFDITKSRLAE